MGVEREEGEHLLHKTTALPVSESRTSLKQIKLNVNHQHSSNRQGATHKSYHRTDWLSKYLYIMCSEEKVFLSDVCSKCDDGPPNIFSGFAKIADNFLPQQALFQCGHNFINSLHLGRYKGTDHRTRN